MPNENECEPPSSGCSSLQQTLRTFSQRLIAAQRSIRPLEAIKWDEQVEREFLAGGGRELPKITRDDYRPLPFDPDEKQMEFQDLERDVLRTLGEREGPGRILVRMCREYTGLVRLLAYRGTTTFGTISKRLFGTALNGAGESLVRTLDDVSHCYPASCASEEPVHTAEETRRELENRLSGCFEPEGVRFKIVDRIVTDPAAGTHYLKLRRDARYSDADMRMLEVHEGWIHLGTSFNARSQNACAFLSRGAPTSTRTQEGLALLSELASGAATHRRVNSLRQRVLGIRKAEEGADFRDIYRFLHENEPDERECYLETSRIFRGSLPSGAGPFTRDLSCAQGLAAVAPIAETDRRFPLLFCGKTAVEDLNTLEELSQTGLLAPPRFIPPPFADGKYPQISPMTPN